MKYISIALLALMFYAASRIGAVLNPEAVALALGVLIGIMASVTGAVLVIVASRQPRYEPPPVVLIPPAMTRTQAQALVPYGVRFYRNEGDIWRAYKGGQRIGETMLVDEYVLMETGD